MVNSKPRRSALKVQSTALPGFGIRGSNAAGKFGSWHGKEVQALREAADTARKNGDKELADAYLRALSPKSPDAHAGPRARIARRTP